MKELIALIFSNKCVVTILLIGMVIFLIPIYRQYALKKGIKKLLLFLFILLILVLGFKDYKIFIFLICFPYNYFMIKLGSDKKTSINFLISFLYTIFIIGFVGAFNAEIDKFLSIVFLIFTLLLVIILFLVFAHISEGGSSGYSGGYTSSVKSKEEPTKNNSPEIKEFKGDVKFVRRYSYNYSSEQIYSITFFGENRVCSANEYDNKTIIIKLNGKEVSFIPKEK